MTNQKERWVVMAKRADFEAISEKFKIDPVTARIIRNRDIVGDDAILEFLRGGLAQLHPPGMMKDMKKATDLLCQAIEGKEKIRIIGDYDIDGVMSTYILLTGLTRLGAKVDTYIPDRIQDGYGMREHLVRRAAEDDVDMILTCDNGIAAVEEIALARELGMKVVITDHHNIPYREEDGKRVSILPHANAIINPKQEDCSYPFKELCGAAVAYKLVTALYERYDICEEELEELLELAAFATVGDIMDLKEENRIIVKEGLKRLQNPSNLGLRALIQVTGLEGKPISAYHIGFVLGPCINASGRLDTAARALKLLRAQNHQEALKLAGDLYDMNESRKAMTAEGVEEAVKLVETSSLKEDRVLVVYLPQCHESLAGIIAGRLRERYYRPTFILTKGEQSVKGSGRSIEGYSMYDELTSCRELLLQFGGHPMAAGLSIEECNVSRLRKRLNEVCTLTKEELMPKVTIDVPMPISYVRMSLAEEFALLEPFGKGNPRPMFAQKGIRVMAPRVVGRNRNVVQMKLMDESGTVFPGVYFGDGEDFCRKVLECDTIDMVYYPQIQEWNGQVELKITIQSVRFPN